MFIGSNSAKTTSACLNRNLHWNISSKSVKTKSWMNYQTDLYRWQFCYETVLYSTSSTNTIVFGASNSVVTPLGVKPNGVRGHKKCELTESAGENAPERSICGKNLRNNGFSDKTLLVLRNNAFGNRRKPQMHCQLRFCAEIGTRGVATAPLLWFCAENRHWVRRGRSNGIFQEQE